MILKPISKNYEANEINKQHIHVGIEDTERGFERFVETWERAEHGQIKETEIHLNFKDLSMLLSIHTDASLPGSESNFQDAVQKYLQLNRV